MNLYAQLDSIRATDHPPAKLRGEVLANRQPRWLTDVVAAVVHAQRGTVKAIAYALGVRDAAVYEAADLNNPKPLKAHWIPVVCRETGSLAVLEAIAEQCGAVVFALPVVVNPDHAEIVTRVAQSMRECADVFAASGTSLADGRITDQELQHVERQIHEAHAELEALRMVMAQKAKAA